MGEKFKPRQDVRKKHNHNDDYENYFGPKIKRDRRANEKNWIKKDPYED